MPQSNYLSTAHCGDVIIERFLDYLYLIPWQTKTKSRTEGSGADQMRRSFSGKLSPGYRLLRFAAVIIQNAKSSFQGGRDDGLDEAAGLINGRGVSICP